MIKKLLAVFSVGILLLGMLTGCGSNNSNSGEKVIKIATQSPLSGSNSAPGEGVKLGAQLALKERAAEFKKLGYKIQLAPYDDKGDPTQGVSNAQNIVANPEILGVVGHYNSGVAIPSSVVYDKNHLVMVSPFNTAVAVTDRGLPTVNRICARDDFQGPAGAKYAYETLNAKTMFIIQDKTAYGTGLADQVKSSFEAAGGKVVGYEGITIGDSDFSGVLNTVAQAKPDILYFAGVYAEGGLIVKQARAKGINVPIMGADGLDSSTLVSIAGDAIKGVYYTSVGADVTKTPDGPAFVQKYKEAFNKQPEATSAYGYDCMNILLDAIKKCINDNGGKMPTRQKITQAVRATKDRQGVVTNVTFDAKGDNDNAKVYIYKFDQAVYPPNMVNEVSK